MTTPARLLAALAPLLAAAAVLPAAASAVTPPAVTAVTPANGATGVIRTAQVSVTFNQPMNRSLAQTAFSLAGGTAGDTAVAGRFSWSGNTMTFTPSAPLAGGSLYLATERPVKSIAGGLSAAVTWQFTAAAQPLVTAISPANGATGVYPNRAVTVSFDSPMDTSATQAAFSLVRTSDGSPVAGRFSWSGSKLSFKPVSDLAAGIQYTARLTTGARDLAGHPIPAARTWSFAISPNPIVESVTPRDGAAGIGQNAVVKVTFSQPMDRAATESAFLLYVEVGGAENELSWPGTFSWSGNTMSYTPSTPYWIAYDYFGTVKIDARSQTGYPLIAAKTWSFGIYAPG